MKHLFKLILLSLSASSLLSAAVAAAESATAPAHSFKIGWIGAMTGPYAKYGTVEAAAIAVDDINREGGVLGKRLELVMEDGQGSGSAAATAFRKLVHSDKVKFIVGGHCSTESEAIAPLASKNGIVVLAAITSSPKLSNADPFFFRITPVSTIEADLTAHFARSKAYVQKSAVLVEQTDYALPLADRFSEQFELLGGLISSRDEVLKAETDVRSLARKIAARQPGAVYLAAQTQDFADAAIKQLRQYKFTGFIFGNATTGNSLAASPADRVYFTGLIFSDLRFDRSQPQTAAFIQAYKTRYHVPDLAFGVFTAEAYDAVRLLVQAINKAGDNPAAVAKELAATRGYRGVAGDISINDHHDGVRSFELKTISDDGKVQVLDSGGK